MSGPAPGRTDRDPDLAAVTHVISAVRERAPLVHCITATVSMGICQA